MNNRDCEQSHSCIYAVLFFNWNTYDSYDGWPEEVADVSMMGNLIIFANCNGASSWRCLPYMSRLYVPCSTCHQCYGHTRRSHQNLLTPPIWRYMSLTSWLLVLTVCFEMRATWRYTLNCFQRAFASVLSFLRNHSVNHRQLRWMIAHDWSFVSSF